jgi:hypothetical protein
MATIEYEQYIQIDYTSRIDPQPPLFREATNGMSWDNFSGVDDENKVLAHMFLVNFNLPMGVNRAMSGLNMMGLAIPDARDLVGLAKSDNFYLKEVLACHYGVVCLSPGKGQNYFPVLRYPKHERLELDLNIHDRNSHPWSRLYLFLGVERHRIRG